MFGRQMDEECSFYDETEINNGYNFKNTSILFEAKPSGLFDVLIFLQCRS